MLISWLLCSALLVPILALKCSLHFYPSAICNHYDYSNGCSPGLEQDCHPVKTTYHNPRCPTYICVSISLFAKSFFVLKFRHHSLHSQSSVILAIKFFVRKLRRHSPTFSPLSVTRRCCESSLVASEHLICANLVLITVCAVSTLLKNCTLLSVANLIVRERLFIQRSLKSVKSA